MIIINWYYITYKYLKLRPVPNGSRFCGDLCVPLYSTLVNLISQNNNILSSEKLGIGMHFLHLHVFLW